MALDTATLRVAFSVAALTLLVLFYAVTFRRTRAAYSAWWCVAIALFLTGSAAYLLDGTGHQWWANPSANVLLVAGAASVWTGARSLHPRKPNIWMIVIALAATAVTAAFDNPSVNTWPGGEAFLGLMSLFIGLASVELFRLDRNFTRVRLPMAAVTGVLAFYYLGRLIAYVIAGPNSHIFQIFFGSAVTTLITLALMIVASFGMTTFSTEQAASDLRRRAMYDGLTGLLNRNAFLDLASAKIRDLRRARALGSLILADLDHFKLVNDTYGHAAGDRALRTFAAICTDTVRSTDLVGRYGGEEFILLLPGAEPEQAEAIAQSISLNLRQAASHDPALPTVSYGIAPIGISPGGLEATIAAADTALYRAKTHGRDRVVLTTFKERTKRTTPSNRESYP